jgi:hypothetical protein
VLSETTQQQQQKRENGMRCQTGLKIKLKNGGTHVGPGMSKAHLLLSLLERTLKTHHCKVTSNPNAIS